MNFVYYENEIVLLGEEGEMLARVTFPKVSEGIVDVNHTFVDVNQRGKGLAKKMMEELVKYLKSTNRKAIVTCSYAKKWFEENPEYAEIKV